jgi:plastocyanin
MSSGSSTSSAGTPSSSSADAAAEVLSITDFAYKVPVSVTPGATITIKNADSQAHTVTSKAGGFDVKVDPHGTATLTAPSKPGRYPFVCTFHANMTGTLVVK